MRNTCTFPGYKYRVVGQNEFLHGGDKINYRNPVHSNVDYWTSISRPKWPAKVKDVIGDRWVVIRPL